MPPAPGLHGRPGLRPQPAAPGRELLRRPEARPCAAGTRTAGGGGRRAAAGPRLPRRRRRRRRRRSAFLNGTYGQSAANRAAWAGALGAGRRAGRGRA